MKFSLQISISGPSGSSFANSKQAFKFSAINSQKHPDFPCSRMLELGLSLDLRSGVVLLHRSGPIIHTDSLISLVGIKSAVGESGPLKETNKSRQVLERDPRGIWFRLHLERTNKPRDLYSCPCNSSGVLGPGLSF